MMAPELAAAVGRLAHWSARLATHRDDAILARPERTADLSYYNQHATTYGHAAAIAADAGLCEISTALDYDLAVEITGTARPSIEHYAAAIVRAVEANR